MCGLLKTLPYWLFAVGGTVSGYTTREHEHHNTQNTRPSMITSTSAAQQAARALQHTRFESYWLDSVTNTIPQAPLIQDINCDLLIVGAGFSGLWAAIQAKEKQPDREIVVIEGHTVAHGASGRPAAIMSTSVMHGIENTQRSFPQDVARLEQLGIENMRDFKQTLDAYDIDCDVEWSGEMVVSIGEQGIESIERDHALYQAHGHSSEILDKAQIQQEIHSPLFSAAVWSRKLSGTVHPAKLSQQSFAGN